MKRLGNFMLVVVAMAAALAYAEAPQNNDDKLSPPAPGDEASLIAVLQGNGDWTAKQTACRGLRRVGTAKAAPVLAALLNDDQLGHLARYALEPIPGEEASAALRGALGKATGGHKAGVAISLGVRRDAKAVKPLAALLKEENVEIAKAAAGALGRIGTNDAVQALLNFEDDKAPEAVRGALAEGMLTGAENVAIAGNKKLAAKIYEELSEAEWPAYARLGAFRGSAHLESKEAPDRIVKALGGDDTVMRDFAAQLVAETSGEDATKAYVAALPKLPTASQAALLNGLAKRKDGAARPAVLQAVNSADEGVKLAAIRALATLGTKDDVAALAKLLEAKGAPADAAKEVLHSLKGDGVNEAIAAAQAGAASPLNAQLLELLADRVAPQTVAIALKEVKSANEPDRIAALRALGQLGNAQQAPAVLDALKTRGGAERDTAAESLSAICRVYGDETLPALADGAKDANAEARVLIVRSMGRVTTPKGLEAVVAAVGDKEAGVGDEAARVLSNWPSGDAAPHLLKLAEGKNESRHDLGLRGYVRLARGEGDGGKKIEMLNAAMKATQSKQDKWQVIAAWGTLAAPQALDTLRPYLDQADFQKEAGAAIIAVSGELAKQGDDGKKLGKEAIQLVQTKCKDDGIQDRAKKALEKIG